MDKGTPTYKVEFLKVDQMVKNRSNQKVEADMVQIDPAHHKFFVKVKNERGSDCYELVACFPSHIIEAVTKVDK